MSNIIFRREWAMPSGDTFSIKPIKNFVEKYLVVSEQVGMITVDPFARNSDLTTYSNDINPKTSAHKHMDAVDYLNELESKGCQASLVILDPPYSPRQISECYKELGLPVTMETTQNARFYKNIKDATDKIVKDGGYVLNFGWNSSGMGKDRGYEIVEILLVAHGSAHNDTICMAERKL
jgi:hypothetical protein